MRAVRKGILRHLTVIGRFDELGNPRPTSRRQAISDEFYGHWRRVKKLYNRHRVLFDPKVMDAYIKWGKERGKKIRENLKKRARGVAARAKRRKVA